MVCLSPSWLNKLSLPPTFSLSIFIIPFLLLGIVSWSAPWTHLFHQVYSVETAISSESNFYSLTLICVKTKPCILGLLSSQTWTLVLAHDLQTFRHLLTICVHAQQGSLKSSLDRAPGPLFTWWVALEVAGMFNSLFHTCTHCVYI